MQSLNNLTQLVNVYNSCGIKYGYEIAEKIIKFFAPNSVISPKCHHINEDDFFVCYKALNSYKKQKDITEYCRNIIKEFNNGLFN